MLILCCTGCNQALRLAGEPGKVQRFRCPKCGTVLTVPEEPQVTAPREDSVTARPAKAATPVVMPPPAKREALDDYEVLDDARGDERRERDHERRDDDYRERPWPSRPEIERPASSSSLMLGMLIGGGIVALVAVAALIIFLAVPRREKEAVALGDKGGAAGDKGAAVGDKNPGDKVAEKPLEKIAALETLKGGKFVKPPPAAAPTSYLHVISTAGDYIGQGKRYTYGGELLMVKAGGGGVHISVDGWHIDFVPGRGGILAPGVYEGARRYPFNDAAPGINFSGHGRGCNRIAGRFVVWELEWRGDVIDRLAIDFIQNCEETMPPLFGRLRYQSSLQ